LTFEYYLNRTEGRQGYNLPLLTDCGAVKSMRGNSSPNGHRKVKKYDIKMLALRRNINILPTITYDATRLGCHIISKFMSGKNPLGLNPRKEETKEGFDS